MKEGNFQRNWSCVEKWKIYMILLNRKNNILSWCDEIKSNYLLKRSKKKKMKLYKNSVTKSGRRNVIGRASRTGISGLEVVTSQRKEEVVPEVRNQRKKLLEWSFKQKLPLSLLQLLSTFKILSNRFYLVCYLRYWKRN